MNRQLAQRSLLISTGVATVALGAFARQPERGYRGFVDWTNRIFQQLYEAPAHNGGKYSWSQTNYSPGLSTSHGYQFNPWLFVGAGIDYSLQDGGIWNGYGWDLRHYDFHNYFLSIFGDIRTDLQFGKFTPFADIRLGWNATSTGTVYFSPSIGYRFNWGRKVGINVGVGYTYDGYRYEDFITGTTPEGWTIYVPTGEYVNLHRSSFTFRVGFDF